MRRFKSLNITIPDSGNISEIKNVLTIKNVVFFERIATSNITRDIRAIDRKTVKPPLKDGRSTLMPSALDFFPEKRMVINVTFFFSGTISGFATSNSLSTISASSDLELTLR